MIANANITKFNKTTKFILIVFKHVLNAKKRATKKVALTIVLLPIFNVFLIDLPIGRMFLSQ